MKWPHTPSHIDIVGITRADHLAQVGGYKSPVLFGQISVHPRREGEPQEEGDEDDPIEGWGGWEPEEAVEEPQRPPPPSRATLLQRTPQRPTAGGLVGTTPPTPPSKAPLWDIEVCTPVQ